MSAPVDALAVLDRAMTQVRHCHEAHEIQEARNAIAELIEAATKVDALSRGEGDWSDEKNVEKAVLRMRAALDRVGGAA